METTLNNLGLVHIKDATEQALKEIKDRKDNLIRPLKTRWEKFNDLIGGGIEFNNLITIAGISGAGKSSIANELETALFDYNPGENFVVLSWNYEMTNKAQVIRKLSYKTNLTVNEIKSGKVKISDDQYNSLAKEAKDIAKYKIYYAEKTKTPEEMCQMVRLFHEECKKEYGKDCGLICFLDHTRLTKKKTNEFDTINSLQEMFIELKKEDKRTFVQLSQLNRSIESVDRVSNPLMHFPQRSDVFGADSVYQSSDLVVCAHRPELLNLQYYSLNNYAVKNKVYVHGLKVREGEPAPIRFINNLKYNRIDEDPVLPKINESN